MITSLEYDIALKSSKVNEPAENLDYLSKLIPGVFQAAIYV